MSLDRINLGYFAAGAFLLAGIYLAYYKYQQGPLGREFRKLDGLQHDSVLVKVDEIKKRFSLNPEEGFEFDLQILGRRIDKSETERGIQYAEGLKGKLEDPTIKDLARSRFYYYRAILEGQKDSAMPSQMLKFLNEALRYSTSSAWRAHILVDRAHAYLLLKETTKAMLDVEEAQRLTNDPKIQQICKEFSAPKTD